MIKTFVINLDSDLERMVSLSSRLNDASIEYERISAFDGRSVNKDELGNYFYKHHQIKLPDKVSGAQVGCFLSHFSAWEKVANGEADYAFVFEDDIHFSPDIKKFIHSSEWLPVGFDIIRLEVSTNRLLLSEDNKTSFIGRNIHQLNSTSWCAGAYVLSKNCAKKLISFKLERFISADAFLFSFEVSKIASQLNIYQVAPAIAIQDKFYFVEEKLGYESNIETNPYLHRLWWKLKTYVNIYSCQSFFKKTILGYKKVKFK